MSLGRLVRTVRHLKPAQMYGRVLYLLPQRTPPVAEVRPSQTDWERWVQPALRLPAIRPDGQFDVLGEAHDLDAIGWDCPEIAKLWRYNLHYFDDLVSHGWDDRTDEHRRLIERWIAENPPAAGTGWEPYPLSRRIVNWIKWLCAGNAPAEGMLASLGLQTQWLTLRLETHLLGNHLFANAKALVFAGNFFAGEAAQRWRTLGTAILNKEIDEQMLPDGGQFELSTLYHSLAVEDLLDLVNILGASDENQPGNAALASQRRTTVSAALRWMLGLRHPDGEIAFFNDAAIGIAPPPGELLEYAHRLSITPATSTNPLWLADTGYVRAERGVATLFADVARIGPDYLPGHAHADTLSFELSLGDERFLVNGGTSLYGAGAERVRQRGTAAHNTVAIDGHDSSEVWSGFRVGRRAYPRDVSVREDASGVVISAAHDGYRWLAGRPLHRRSWLLDDEGLTINDNVTAPAGHQAVAAFRFHPSLRLSSQDDGASGRAQAPSGRAMRWSVERGRADFLAATWHPRFGSSEATRQLRVVLAGGSATVRFAWDPA